MSENSSQGNNNVSEFNRFLNNNQDFIYSKYAVYFDEQQNINTLLHTEILNKCLKFIYHIFSFQKYESNPKLNATLREGLTSNITEYVSLAIKKGVKYFTNEESVNLLKYCIENNQMFAVHYDRKNAKKNEPEKQQNLAQSKSYDQIKQPITQPIHNQEIEQQKENNQPQKLSPPIEQTVHNPSSPPKLQQTVRQNKSLLLLTHQQQILTLSNPIKHDDPEIIRRQLKSIFEFYCKQKQNITPNSTFDNINQKSQTMNIGKFLYFAGAVNIIPTKDNSISQTSIDRKIITSIFKRLAEGRSLIDFKIFFSIMEELRKKDDKIYTRLGLGQQGPLAKSKIQDNLKPWNLPFYTKDPQGREKLNPQGKTFVPKLTSHSGKIQQSLKDELVFRKQRAYFDESGRTIFKGRALSKLQNDKDNSGLTLRLGDKNNQTPEGEQLKFLSKLITHEQNDQIFLKQYHLPNRKNNNNYKQKGQIGSIDQRSSLFVKEAHANKQLHRFAGDSLQKSKQTHFLPAIKLRQSYQIPTERRSQKDRSLGYKF